MLIYSGIHYDAATIAPFPDAPPDFHQTVVPVVDKEDSDAVLVAAKKLADKLRAKRAYTNTATFDLKCQVSIGYQTGWFSATGVAADVRATDLW